MALKWLFFPEKLPEGLFSHTIFITNNFQKRYSRISEKTMQQNATITRKSSLTIIACVSLMVKKNLLHLCTIYFLKN